MTREPDSVGRRGRLAVLFFLPPDLSTPFALGTAAGTSATRFVSRTRPRVGGAPSTAARRGCVRDAWGTPGPGNGGRRATDGSVISRIRRGLARLEGGAERAPETRPESEIDAVNPQRNESDAGAASAQATEEADPRDPSRVSGERAPSSGRSLDALPVLLTMGEVAVLLRTSRKAAYAMAERGQLAGLIRIGRRLLVRRDDLVLWLDERRAASPGGSRR
jgi:excisionase family DNA binding protein